MPIRTSEKVIGVHYMSWKKIIGIDVRILNGQKGANE